MEKIIRVKGISSKGTETVMNYTYPDVLAHSDFEALQMAIEWANREYSCEYDSDYKPVPHSTYKEFETITSIEITKI